MSGILRPVTTGCLERNGHDGVAGDGRRSWTVQSHPVSTSGFPAAASADDRAVTAERCAAQLLCGDRAGRPEEVARRLLAIQAQDPRGARLAVRARSAGLSASDVDSALARRALVVTWLNRGTLHLVRAEDYWWLHPLTTPQLRTGNSRRLAQEGVPPQDAERAVAAVRAALAADGPLTRSQLRERVAAAGVRTEGQALVHILALATIRGLIVRGPAAGRDQAFVLARDWLGAPPPPMSREAALAELARRYLAGHAPAADADLARWAGIGLRDARLGLAECGAVQGADGLAGRPATPGRPGCPGCRAATATAARRVRPAAARLGIPRPYHRPAPADRHGQRAVPAIRPSQRPGRGDLDHQERPDHARTVCRTRPPDPRGAANRRRRRDTVPHQEDVSQLPDIRHGKRTHRADHHSPHASVGPNSTDTSDRICRLLLKAGCSCR
jgi:hypothetical protein